MPEKRRDNKNRVLRNGENQRKDGRYEYKYVNAKGERKTVYSWKLVETDKTPDGRKNDISLREKIKLIQKDIDDGISCISKMTVLELVQKYILQKQGVKENTKRSYRFVVNLLKRESFGSREIDKVKISDAKEWFIKMQMMDKKSYGTISVVRKIVKPAFDLAISDDYIRKNPFDFTLKDVVKNDTEKKSALTEKQEKAFLDFIKSSNVYSKYYDMIYLLLNTGLRVSEFVGLTKSDIDFKGNRICIDHQLIDSSSIMYIDTTKTDKERYIPMLEDVNECLRRVIAKRTLLKVEPIIDGMSGFLFLRRNGKPLNSRKLEQLFNRIVAKYNKSHKEQLPNITPHILRHTFCTRRAIAGMNPKILQYIMGHSDVKMTLDYYTHVDYENAEKEMKKIGIV